MRSIGSEYILMVTDRGQAGAEHPAEAMVNYIEKMLSLELSEKEIKNMVCHVPKSIAEG